MILNYFSVSHIYTMLLFFTLCYLLILEKLYFPKYVDVSTKIAIHINRYHLVLLAVAFCFSLVISVFFFAASTTGEAMGQTLIWYITHGLGSEELRPTHEIVYSSATGEYTVFNKQTGDRIHIPVEAKEEINRSTLTVDQETGKDDDHSTTSSQVHSTSGKEKGFLGDLANILFRNLPQEAQQKVLSQAAHLLKNQIIESNLEVGDKKAALMIADNLADPKKALPASQLGRP